MRQVPARALELPGRPVTTAHLQHVVALILTEVEARSQVDDIGGEIAVDGGAHRWLRGLDRDLAGTLPEHARDDGSVPIEFVPHVVSSFRTVPGPLTWIWGRKNPPRGEGHRRDAGLVGPPRAYRISTRTLRSNSCVVGIVVPVYEQVRRCQPTGTGGAAVPENDRFRSGLTRNEQRQ